ncbi:sialic acid-binding Ig-like lectin 15 isoform X2 [Pygocentrus nattereri]|uniref:Ig-like domain-containing protein n=1 Tax=Pygocentrus nattereri TaxID=42514 RepID=A0A3B4DYC5_PYGNA|nr:sialic acid-binding Ig-like lectin 15 isoform X2 [Pygocentrus nattereri]
MKMQLVQVAFFLCCSPGLMADNKWSMTVPKAVEQNFGEDAIIPCSFTAPYQDYQGNLKAIWRTKSQVIFRCVSKGNPSESGQNCTESNGRYSLSGDPRRNNISLRIKNTLFMDAERYFCRVELNKQGGAYETSTGTILNIRGEQFVACDVKGTPPPTVTWIFPENINASLVSVQSSLSRASSTIPANLPNTNYTCQIHGKNRTQHLSIYFRGAQEQQQQIPFPFFLVVTILSAVFFIIFLVTLAVLYKKGSSEHVDTATQMKMKKTKYTEKDEDVYMNV